MARHADQVKVTRIFKIRFNPRHQGRRYPENASAFGGTALPFGLGPPTSTPSVPAAWLLFFLRCWGGIRDEDFNRSLFRSGAGFGALSHAISDAFSARCRFWRGLCSRGHRRCYFRRGGCTGLAGWPRCTWLLRFLRRSLRGGGLICSRSYPGGSACPGRSFAPAGGVRPIGPIGAFRPL